VTRLNGGGSTFVYPMMSKWTSEYEKAKGVQVNYQAIGSGGGIQQMTAKTFDFGCTDAPMNEEQLQKCRASGGGVVHIPLVMGAVAITYNLDEVKEPLRFSGPVLADIFLGNVKRWNDKALKALNPGADLPDKDIVVVHRSDGSGTTYVFVEYLSKVSPAWKEKVGLGTSVNWPVGIGQKGSEGVAGHVRRAPGSLGYVELTYALQNDMKVGKVRNREGEFVTPNTESAKAAAAAALSDIPDDLRYSITDAPGKESYPISCTVWAVCYDKLPPGKGKAVVNFLRWVTHEGQEYAEAMHYVRLPAGLVERLDKKLDTIQAGP
jgi:phosphate transport system substrate-binding protein